MMRGFRALREGPGSQFLYQDPTPRKLLLVLHHLAAHRQLSLQAHREAQTATAIVGALGHLCLVRLVVLPGSR